MRVRLVCKLVKSKLSGRRLSKGLIIFCTERNTKNYRTPYQIYPYSEITEVFDKCYQTINKIGRTFIHNFRNTKIKTLNALTAQNRIRSHTYKTI